jgi:hypothetical protein
VQLKENLRIVLELWTALLKLRCGNYVVGTALLELSVVGTMLLNKSRRHSHEVHSFIEHSLLRNILTLFSRAAPLSPHASPTLERNSE